MDRSEGMFRPAREWGWANGLKKQPLSRSMLERAAGRLNA